MRSVAKSSFMVHRAVVLLILLALQQLNAQQKETGWTWKDGDGNTHTRAELDTILKEHDLWVKSQGKLGQRADLTDANLNKADLTDANLQAAIINGVDMSETDMTRTELSDIREPFAIAFDRSTGKFVPSCLNFRKANLIDTGLAGFSAAVYYARGRCFRTEVAARDQRYCSGNWPGVSNLRPQPRCTGTTSQAILGWGISRSRTQNHLCPETERGGNIVREVPVAGNQ
jgi:hypothetical protein